MVFNIRQKIFVLLGPQIDNYANIVYTKCSECKPDEVFTVISKQLTQTQKKTANNNKKRTNPLLKKG